MLFTIPGLRKIIRSIYRIESAKLKRQVFGIHFDNPVGLAAGFDKNAKHLSEIATFGFSFIEIGTVTPKPQSGNSKPRLFRLPKDKALINRMGFNNDGVEKISQRLRKQKPQIIIGGNIGKNKTTPIENAVDDYIVCFDTLFDHVDYFVVNVSSPNTPGLRDLQDKEPLKEILSKLQARNNQYSKPKPILLKIAPDLSDSQLDDIIEIVDQTKIKGIIATNTTISREGLVTNQTTLKNIGAGGLSGKPLYKRSNDIIKYLKKNAGSPFVIIGAGGIHSTEDAIEKLNAGASLIQLYTGYIYEGPALVKRINKALTEK